MRLIVALVLACSLFSVPAHAQFMRDHESEGGVRGFHVGGKSRVKRSFQSDAEAAAEFNRILAAIGLSWIADRITLRASDETPNAEAGINQKGERFIFYNALFMQKVKHATAEQWSLVSILAHEMGHHLAFHTELTGRNHEFELEADYFSGFVLRKLGATLDQSHGAMKSISPVAATPTHPGLGQRLQVITIGWTDAGTSASPRGLKQLEETGTAGRAKQDAGEAARARAEAAKQEEAARTQNAEADAKRKADDAAKAEAAKREQMAMLAEQEKARVEAERKAKEAADAFTPGRVFRDCEEKVGGGNFICPEMVVVRAGEFSIGSPANEEGRRGDEGHQRKVTIAKPFAVGKFEVTFAEWDACVAAKGCDGSGPEKEGGDNGWGRDRRPVINVSWNDITKEYLPWLSKKTGKTYRLLTEAEWEYAARARTTTRYSWGDSIDCGKASYDGGEKSDCYYNPGGKLRGTQTVGSYDANAFDLHDMHGNVWEWVEECYQDSYNGAPKDGTATTTTGDCSARVLRGGSWDYLPRLLRSALRDRNSPDFRDFSRGFRLGRTLTP